ncbi:MAG: Wzz/FepE/Etk N-terminal domain-containing protein [bacterium]|nr:Wzz/FepE/Etk N-terminal domain-containing protein [bacterium]
MASNPSVQTSDSSNQIQLTSFLRKWYWFVACLLGAGAIGVTHYFTVTPTYRVAARLLVEQQGQPLDDISGEASQDAAFLPTQAEIIASQKVIGRALKAMKTPIKVKDGEQPLDFILERLEVSPLVGTNVISITYEDSDPSLAIERLNLVIKSYRDELSDREQSTHQQTILLLTEQLGKLREELRVLQTDYQALRRNSPLLGQDHDSAAIQRGMLTRLSEEVIATKNQRVVLENQLDSLTGLQTESGVQLTSFTPTQVDNQLSPAKWASVELLSKLSTDGFINGLNPQVDLLALQQAEVEYAELRKQFGEIHPQVLAVRERVSTLNKRLEVLLHSAPEAIRRELARLARQEKNLNTLYRDEFESAKKLDEFLVKEQSVLDEITLVKTAHDTVVTQLNTLKLADRALAEGRASFSINVLDGPEMSDELVWPEPKILIALCLLAGLGCGAIMVVITEKLKRA